MVPNSLLGRVVAAAVALVQAEPVVGSVVASPSFVLQEVLEEELLAAV